MSMIESALVLDGFQKAEEKRYKKIECPINSFLNMVLVANKK